MAVETVFLFTLGELLGVGDYDKGRSLGYHLLGKEVYVNLFTVLDE